MADETQNEAKKSQRMVRVLMILKEHSSRGHRLTQKDINAYLSEDDIGIGTTKTLSGTIHDLIDAVNPKEDASGSGKCIIRYRKSRNGMITDLYYDPPIDQREAELLADGIMRLGLDKSTEERILGKLAGEFHFEREDFLPVQNTDFTNTALINENIAVIRQAVREGKMLSFVFNNPNHTGELIPVRKQRYVVSPYSVAEFRGVFYLIGNLAPAESCSIYRIDHMTDLWVRSEALRPQNELEEIPDLRAFLAKQTGSAYGTHSTVTMRILVWRYAALRDQFGSKVHFIRHADSSHDIVQLTATEREILDLVFTYGDSLEVISPSMFRRRISKRASEIAEKYRE